MAISFITTFQGMDQDTERRRREPDYFPVLWTIFLYKNL